MNNSEYQDIEALDFERPAHPLQAPPPPPPQDIWVSVGQFTNSHHFYPHPHHVTTASTDPNPGLLATNIVYHSPTEPCLVNVDTNLYGVPTIHPPHDFVYVPELPGFDMAANEPMSQLSTTQPPFVQGAGMDSNVPLPPWPATLTPPAILDVHVPVVPPLAYPTHFASQQAQIDMSMGHSSLIQQAMCDLSISNQSLNLETAGSVDTSRDMPMEIQVSAEQMKPGPGPTERWEKIREKFEKLYIEEKKTLEETMLVLKDVYQFHASPDQFKRQIKKWPKCRKNRRAGEPQGPRISTKGSITKPGEPKKPKRTRPKTAMARLKPHAVEEPTGSPLVPILIRQPFTFTIQEHLASLVKAYIQGFFDAAATSTIEALDAQYKTEGRWKAFYNRCQAVSMIIQKRPVAIPAPPTTQLREYQALQKLQSRLRADNVVRGIIDRRILSEFAQTPCSPYMLMDFWNLCRVLRGIAVRIQGSNMNDRIYVASCAHALRTAFVDRTSNHYAGLIKILEHFVQVPPLQMKHSLDVVSKCTAEIMSTRLGGNHLLVLQAFTDYYRHWDGKGFGAKNRQRLFVEGYKQNLTVSETKFGRDDDRTLEILNSYATAAYHIGRDNDLAKKLAMDMWQRIGQQQQQNSESRAESTSLTSESQDSSGWTTKAQHMVDAATILSLVCSTYDENLRRTQSERRHIKKSMGCNPRTKRGRRKWRKMAVMGPEPPLPVEVGQVTAILRQTVETIKEHYAGSWDGVIAVASLSSQLKGLEKERSPGYGDKDDEPGQVNIASQSRRAARKKVSYHDENNPWVVFATEEVSQFELCNEY